MTYWLAIDIWWGDSPREVELKPRWKSMLDRNMPWTRASVTYAGYGQRVVLFDLASTEGLIHAQKALTSTALSEMVQVCSVDILPLTVQVIRHYSSFSFRFFFQISRTSERVMWETWVVRKYKSISDVQDRLLRRPHFMLVHRWLLKFELGCR